jgi:hypothetical protein
MCNKYIAIKNNIVVNIKLCEHPSYVKSINRENLAIKGKGFVNLSTITNKIKINEIFYVFNCIKIC